MGCWGFFASFLLLIFSSFSCRIILGKTGKGFKKICKADLKQIQILPKKIFWLVSLSEKEEKQREKVYYKIIREK
jgi:hypothetical protein